MSTEDELFHHEVRAWTVGDLRRALEGLPDHLPLVVNVAEGPGGEFVSTQVVVSAGFGVVVNGDGTETVDPQFGIGCEFPTGDYYRQHH